MFWLGWFKEGAGLCTVPEGIFTAQQKRGLNEENPYRSNKLNMKTVKMKKF